MGQLWNNVYFECQKNKGQQDGYRMGTEWESVSSQQRSNRKIRAGSHESPPSSACSDELVPEIHHHHHYHQQHQQVDDLNHDDRLDDPLFSKRTLNHLFLIVDTDHSGTITLEEFASVANSTGETAKFLQKVLGDLFNVTEFLDADTDGSAELSREEFVTWAKSKMTKRTHHVHCMKNQDTMLPKSYFAGQNLQCPIPPVKHVLQIEVASYFGAGTP